LASPIADVRFCPTGGVTAKSAPDYLALPNVVCVGGSWIAPDAMVKEGRWSEIEALAREASRLFPPRNVEPLKLRPPFGAALRQDRRVQLAWKRAT
jgi:hypothetical protein